MRLIEADRVCSPDGFDRLMPYTVQGYEVQSIVQGAEITAAVISAMFTVFVKSQNPSDGRPFGEMIPAEELIDNADQSSIELGRGPSLT